MLYVMCVKDVVKRLCVKGEQDGAKNRSLGNSTRKQYRVRFNFVDRDSLISVSEVSVEPGQSSAMDTKRVLKSVKENRMVNRVKGCRKIQESYDRDVALISGRKSYYHFCRTVCLFNLLTSMFTCMI